MWRSRRCRLEVRWETRNGGPLFARRRRRRVDPARVSSEASWIVTRVDAEVRRFIHVYPKGINIDALRFVEKYAEFVGPELLGGLVKPVRENGWPRPHDGLINRAITVFEECINVSSSIICVIVLENID